MSDFNHEIVLYTYVQAGHVQAPGRHRYALKDFSVSSGRVSRSFLSTLLAFASLLMTVGIPSSYVFARRCAQSLLHVLLHDILHATNVVFRLPHVRELRPSRSSALFPLSNLYAVHVWRIYLDPHLDSHSCQLISEQYRGVDRRVSLPYIDANSAERIAVLEPDEKDIARFDSIDIFIGEETCACTGRVQDLQLRLKDGLDRVDALLHCRWGMIKDLDFPQVLVQSYCDVSMSRGTIPKSPYCSA